ncbi:Beta carbonic anhydrase 5 [Citrus sinensis]|uniref:Carbonic anhydrase n=1 Tax=Citrus clementina TaxID=85681 RepID=V4V549_CITCL|nr:beta carbonic anhydrase 5, chloroplastic isoform X3 [Citrus x clementina]XP_052297681.1 beta carbonic anhydrase 5, chloroplastic-like isoform X2 [Citrus sinensis]ESR47079.1 hypothetical protein CICLE_v10001873mg [Citrus x clementina]KAH9690411.1 Beta carbonic anhydrase 5 [Citrus sinensis]
MVYSIRSKSRSIISSMAALKTSVESTFASSPINRPAGSKTMKLEKIRDAQQGFTPVLKRRSFSKLETSSSSTAAALTRDRTSYKVQDVAKSCGGLDYFEEMKQRFLSFKKNKYFEELEHFQNLAKAQSPKFMVIACADSRNGPSETNAALEFAVNTLEVQNILVIGHSDCGGIQALMRMQDDVDSRQSLTENWVVNAKVAKFRTKAYTAHLSFDQQCRHCEKESISRSILNLLTYPWIEERVRKELLFIHGGYYDLLNCTFEKWTLDYKGSKVDEEEVGRHSIKDHSFWS